MGNRAGSSPVARIKCKRHASGMPLAFYCVQRQDLNKVDLSSIGSEKSDGAQKGAIGTGGSPVARIQEQGYAGGMSLFLYKFEDRKKFFFINKKR